MSNQGLRQAVVRGSTSTALTYEGDWHALFDADSITAGPYEGRLLAWINAKLSASYTNVNEAKQAYAVDQGFNNWDSMGTFTLFGPASLPGYVGDWDVSVTSTLTKTSDNIDTIADQSPASNDVSYSSGARVTDLGSINSTTAAACSGSNTTHVSSNITWPTAGAVLVVTNMDSLSSGADGAMGFGDGAATSPGIRIQFRGGGVIWHRLRSGDGSTTYNHELTSAPMLYSAATPFISSCRWDGTNIVSWTNLSKQTSAHGLTLQSASVPIVLFGEATTGAFAIGPGDWGQGLFYNQTQTDADMEELINWLADRWGITV